MLKNIKDLLDIIIKIILIKTLIKRRPRYKRGRHKNKQTYNDTRDVLPVTQFHYNREN